LDTNKESPTEASTTFPLRRLVWPTAAALRSGHNPSFGDLPQLDYIKFGGILHAWMTISGGGVRANARVDFS